MSGRTILSAHAHTCTHSLRHPHTRVHYQQLTTLAGTNYETGHQTEENNSVRVENLASLLFLKKKWFEVGFEGVQREFEEEEEGFPM